MLDANIAYATSMDDLDRLEEYQVILLEYRIPVYSFYSFIVNPSIILYSLIFYACIIFFEDPKSDTLNQSFVCGFFF